MALSGFEAKRDFGQQDSAAGYSSRLARALAVAGPLIVILLWTAVVRLPFYSVGNIDEYFFSVVASEWLRGGLPYVDAFDIKPPGVFLIYAVSQAIFGASYATFKGMEIVAVALGAWALWAMLRPFAGRRLALWSAALFPVYTLAFDGTSSINMLMQLPFIIAAFAAVVTASDADAIAARRLRAALLAGLAIGAAGMIKQTAIFEAVAVFGLLWFYSAGRLRLKILALFVVGAALPALAFSIYFLAVGHFRDMFDAVVLFAMQRLDDDVVQGYGAELAHALTLHGAAVNAGLRSMPLIFLWGGAIFALLRIDRIKAVVPPRLSIIAVVWLAPAFSSAVFGRMLCDYYLLVIVAPLLILAGTFFCHGIQITPARQHLSLWAALGLATATLIYTEHTDLFVPEMRGLDHGLDMKAVEAFRDLGLDADDKLLVVNRGMELYVETGARPPTPVFHTTHLMTTFRAPVANPLDDALKANPRFVLLADPTVVHVTELPERRQLLQKYLAGHYRARVTVQGNLDSFTIYELRN